MEQPMSLAPGANLRHLLPAPVSASIRRKLGRPRRIAYLETHLVDHCNLNCKGCRHFSCLSPPNLVELQDFRRDFERLAQITGIDTIRLLGGEPLLHPDVSQFVRIARTCFPDSDVSLVTNGLLLASMDESFWDALVETGTRLVVSVYPIRLDLDEIRRNTEVHGVELELSDEGGRFCKIPIRPGGGHSASASFRACKLLDDCPFLQNGRIYTCCYPALAGIPEKRFGVSLPVSDRDSISIYDGIDGYDILEYLSRPIPWCRNCRPDQAELFDWGRTTPVRPRSVAALAPQVQRPRSPEEDREPHPCTPIPNLRS
jgi:hypothetical protein